MRGPVLNISPGLTANGVDMEYRRNAQGIQVYYNTFDIHEKPSSLSTLYLYDS